MADFQIWEWDDDVLYGLAVESDARGVRPLRSLALTLPENLRGGEASRIGAWVKEETVRGGWSGGHVHLLLPREAAIVKRLELPKVPDEELPTMVRMQASIKSSMPLDALAVDFIPLPDQALPGSEGTPGRDVLLATLPKKKMEECAALALAAGWELQSVGLTFAGIAEAARTEAEKAGTSAGTQLVVVGRRKRAEIVLIHQGKVIFSHAPRLPEGDAEGRSQAILSELSRALVAFGGGDPSFKIDMAWLAAENASVDFLKDNLATRFACDVRILDPLVRESCAEDEAMRRVGRGEFLACLGTAQGKADPRSEAIDFLNPRKPPIPKDTKRERMIRMAVLAAVLLLTIGLFGFWEIYSLNAKITELEQMDAGLKLKLTAEEPMLKAYQEVRKWDEKRIPWMQEWAALSARMPSTEKVYLSEMTFESGTGMTRGKIFLRGFARGRGDVVALSHSLVQNQEHYRVLPHNALESKVDKDYPWGFDLEIVLVSPESDAKGKKAKGKASKGTDLKGTESKGKESPAKTTSPDRQETQPSESGRSDGESVRENARENTKERGKGKRKSKLKDSSSPTVKISPQEPAKEESKAEPAKSETAPPVETKTEPAKEPAAKTEEAQPAREKAP